MLHSSPQVFLFSLRLTTVISLSIAGVTIPQALAFKKQLEQIDGVESVTWLDDSVALTEPQHMERHC